MQKKEWVKVFNGIVLVAIAIVIIFIIWGAVVDTTTIEPADCIDVNHVASFVYSSCYDAYTKSVFLEVARSFDSYTLKGLQVSFFDFSQQSYDLEDVPNTEESKLYKISANKNPQELDIVLDVVKDFSAPICEEPRKIVVKYCPVGIYDEGINASIVLLSNKSGSDVIPIGEAAEKSDVFSINLIEKERIWALQCDSNWQCSQWGACEDGVRRRTCDDIRNCAIPTGMPDTTELCDGTCVENWECEWSSCIGGFTIPKCKDLNNCGTSYHISQKLECDSDKECIPNIICDRWSTCDADYNFQNLVGDSITKINGVKSRICNDLNDCVDSVLETQECSISVDIYTKKFSKCGIDYIGIYNKLDDSLIARVDDGTSEKSYLNIFFNGEDEEIYCDYCFDGVKSGDEEGVDCGGSCEDCEEIFLESQRRKKTLWTRFVIWLKRMIT